MERSGRIARPVPEVGHGIQGERVAFRNVLGTRPGIGVCRRRAEHRYQYNHSHHPQAQTAPGPPVQSDTPAPDSSKPSSSTQAQTPAQTPAQTGNTPPGTQPTPGTGPVGSDTPPTTKPPAPGTTPVGGDTPATAVNPDKVVEPGSEKSMSNPARIDDVNAVGNRDIGGRGMGNWYSTDTEIKMGKLYADEIEKSTKFITDPVVAEYVNRIGQNIVKNSDCKVPFTIKVIDSDEINAFALPGGFFYVNSGLILNADEEAEIAGVMAHETAHVCAHHAAREMTRMNYAQIGTIPLIILIGGWTGYGIYEAAQFAIPITFLMFSREFEAQADYLGIQYMYRAGYDPQAFITFFEKIQALEKRKPGLVAKAFCRPPPDPRPHPPLAGGDRPHPPRKRRVYRHDFGVRRCQGSSRAHRKQAPPHRHRGTTRSPPCATPAPAIPTTPPRPQQL